MSNRGDSDRRGRGAGRGIGRGAPDRGGNRGRGRGGPGGPAPPTAPTIFREANPPTIPSQLGQRELDQLVVSFKKLAVTPHRPNRPGFGTLGTPGLLRTNFFALKVPKGPFYDYSVDIQPKPGGKDERLRIWQLIETTDAFRTNSASITHDQSSRLVSVNVLPQPLVVRVNYFEQGQQPNAGGGKVFKVTFTLDKELDMVGLNRYLEGRPDYKTYDPLPILSALNLVVQRASARNGVRAGNGRFFFSELGKFRLGTGIEGWKGFFLSVRPGFKQLYVNVNTCMTAFVQPGNLADALNAFGQNSRGAMPTLPTALMKSIRVRTKHLGHKKAIKRIATTSARNTNFDCAEYGGKISVEAFFKRKYNITLRYAVELPVVDLASRQKTQPIWVPAEVCEIEPGQVFNGKLGSYETSQMIKYACNPPGVNAQAITQNGLPLAGLSPASTTLQAFGMSVSSEMTGIPFRELPPPRLSYRSGQPRVANASWNILDVKFHKGAPIKSWWVLVVRDGNVVLEGPNDPRLRQLVERFSGKLARSGMQVPQGLPRLLHTTALPPVSQDPGRVRALNEIKTILSDEMKSKKNVKPSFVLVLLSHRDDYIYPGIKRIGDVELGLQTIHMQLGTALGDERKQDQYLSNIALKVNTKLGGMNHLLEKPSMAWLSKKSTMLVGIDVTHPSPLSKGGSPSIAAVVASIDNNFVQFPASMRIQRQENRESKEMVSELRDMMVERLQLFLKHNKFLPERVIIFRDGVSEGQYDTVLREELPEVQKAFRRVGGQQKYNPALSIVICGKRHHARFWPTTAQAADRNGNTRPGTVVDQGITGIFDFDFYLQAHAGLKGQARPTHYIVIYDELGLGADEIQQGINHTSYLYARATKGVSLIPPAYYADLACERGRCYLNDFLNDDTVSSAGSKKPTKEEEARLVFEASKRAWGNGLHPDMRESMFYI